MAGSKNLPPFQPPISNVQSGLRRELELGVDPSLDPSPDKEVLAIFVVRHAERARLLVWPPPLAELIGCETPPFISQPHKELHFGRQSSVPNQTAASRFCIHHKKQVVSRSRVEPPIYSPLPHCLILLSPLQLHLLDRIPNLKILPKEFQFTCYNDDFGNQEAFVLGGA